MYNHTNMERELITVGVEYALLQMGPQELEKVEACLASDYHCKIADCLEHPEYLKQVLSELFGNYYQDILDDVKQVVRGADADCHVEEFLTVLNTKQLVA